MGIYTSLVHNYKTIYQKIFFSKYKTLYKFLDGFITHFLNLSLINSSSLS